MYRIMSWFWEFRCWILRCPIEIRRKGDIAIWVCPKHKLITEVSKWNDETKEWM